LFSGAKGKPKGGSPIKLPFSDSMQEKMLELRREFWLHNDTQMMVNAVHLYKRNEQMCVNVYRGMVY
jgi:hypothetical protein